MGKDNILIIAEKPDAAMRIAQALDEGGKPSKGSKGKVPYFQALRNGDTLTVVPALGHLYTVSQATGRRDEYPIFELEWAPRYRVERGASQTRAWVKAISELAAESKGFICACDLDIEGSVIGYNVLKYACGEKDGEAKRMRFSTLTETELVNAYENPMPHLDYPFVESGLTRHEVDFLYGVNLTRALTLAAKKTTGKHFTLSTGRVQGPTLEFLVQREKEILSFVPTPYWSVKAEVKLNGETVEAVYERDRIEAQADADKIVETCDQRKGVVRDVEVREFRVMPPTPFNIGDLQIEAYRLFGFTPSRTLGIAERLYLSALISYPRTSSQKLPETVETPKILDSLGQDPSYKPLVNAILASGRLKPNEGKKVDSAHPSIYPTGKLPEAELSPPEQKLYDLVVRRFMAVFGEPALRQSLKVVVDNAGYVFNIYGRKVLKEGWQKFYQPYVKSEEVVLPTVSAGEEVFFTHVIREDKFIEPPPRFNPSSLLRFMEEQEIGTKATRAEIIDTLYRRSYIREERMAVTDLGFGVAEMLQLYCPRVMAVDLTRSLEKRMEAIEAGEEKRLNVLEEAVNHLKPILEELRSHEADLGRELSTLVKTVRLQERVVGSCPTCGTGNLIILRSRRTGKRFVGCSNFFNGLCKASYPLPQLGTLMPTGRPCQSCGWLTVQVRKRGGRPWILCLNPACPRKEEIKRGKVSNLPEGS